QQNLRFSFHYPSFEVFLRTFADPRRNHDAASSRQLAPLCGRGDRNSRVIEVASCGFVPLSADPLGAGMAFEVKCLLAINSIARADCAKGRLRVDIFLPNWTGWLFDPDCSRRKLRMTLGAKHRPSRSAGIRRGGGCCS